MNRNRKLLIRRMREFLNALERDVEVLERRAEPAVPDGFGSGGSGGGGSSSGWSDPVAHAAARREKYRTPSSEDLASHALAKLDTAFVLLEQADGCRKVSRPPDGALAPQADAERCSHCITFTVDAYSTERIFEPRAIGKDAPATCTWCRWCYRWQKAHGFLPPVELVRKHHRGDRISERDAREAVAAHEAAQAAKEGQRPSQEPVNA